MFPDFNIYSSPLLILVLQGLILVGLLFYSAYNRKNRSNFLLALLLLVTCYHRTTYTIGFMGWYDTFQNTKINYFLVSFYLSIGPLIYLYLKSLAQRGYDFQWKHLLHFIPQLVFVFFRALLFFYDRNQSGFEETQNGELMQFNIEYLDTAIVIFFMLHLSVYLFLAFRRYLQYKAILVHEYSNTYKHELGWVRIFLLLFTFLFLYNLIQSGIDEFVYELHWTHVWWYHFFALVVVIYIGVKGYFTPLEGMPKFDFNSIDNTVKNEPGKSEQLLGFEEEVNSLNEYILKDKIYQNPNLSLSMLSRKLKYSPAQLSQIINRGANKNFNDYINTFRVDEVKVKLQSSEYNHLSIMALALDSGFNSKATFNRVFKKLSGHSPSFYRSQQEA